MNRRVLNSNILSISNPNLAAEWHPTKNGALTPKNISYGSSKKVWWICKKGHEWEATVNDRSSGTGCPYCSGRLVSSENNLKHVNPNLAKEWHPTKNENLKPEDVTYGSGKKVWWKCKKGHEWEAIISNRIKGISCPYCAGLYPTKSYNLNLVNPQLAQEWHSARNIDLKPINVLPNSNKKVWWICSKGHEWQAAISKRNSGQGCPYCIGKKVSKDNNLEFLNPKLAQEWHPTKNKNLTPKDVTLGSTKKVWWKCNRGHEWETTINNRSRGTNCPFCSGNKASSENNLKILNPNFSKEWHASKNGDLKPEDVLPNSTKKVWWICKKGHEWRARIGSRNNGTGCPYCTSATSLIELRVYSELKYLFKNVKHRLKLFKQECDVFLPTLNLAIEIDGVYWHKKKYDKDLKKNSILNNEGITVLRIREKGLKKISKIDIFKYKNQTDFELLKSILLSILKQFKLKKEEKVKSYIKKGKLANDKEFKKLLELLPSPFPGTSLTEKNKKIAAEWHPTKNGNLTPKDVTPGSNMKLWWMCKKGHEWETTVSSRNRGNDCPFCSGRMATPENNLKIINPDLAKEWHPTKNGRLKSYDVTPSSNKKVWWICSKGHEWESVISSRNNGSGCPYCRGKKASNDYNLTIMNKVISEEWHPTKNGDLTPKNVTPGSHMKVWWMCKKNHEWKASIYSRSDGAGCPYCSRRKASDEYNLEKINPKLSKEWHPYKNGLSLPKYFTPNSGKKIWWICSKGHEWKATIDSRNSGSGCPYCSGNKVSNDNNLKKINPRLAKEWHPTKNGKLTPFDVTSGSHKKVWWFCSKGHQWIAEIKSRNYGLGCPYCSRRKASEEYNLEKINPDLSKEWHPKKNGKLTPRDVTPSSNKKIWWKCQKGHEWQAKIVNRKNGRGCPFCSGKRVSDENCLESINPKLAKEWHPKKNGSLTPRDFTTGSNKKVWWMCKKGHEWQSTINNRNRGSNCPYCHKEKKL